MKFHRGRLVNPIYAEDEIKGSVEEAIFEENLAENFPQLKRDVSPYISPHDTFQISTNLNTINPPQNKKVKHYGERENLREILISQSLRLPVDFSSVIIYFRTQ